MTSDTEIVDWYIKRELGVSDEYLYVRLTESERVALREMALREMEITLK